MTSKWGLIPLSKLTLTPVTYGIVQPGQDTPGGVPMLRVNNFQHDSLNLSEVRYVSAAVESKYARTRLQENDVLLTIVGSVGQVARVPLQLAGWNIARAVALIRPANPDYGRWIEYVLRTPSIQHQLRVTANTTVQTTINLKDLRDLVVPFPPKGIREEICQSLSALDDRIQNLRQTNATLEVIAQALFKSWFVDFDPVRAKAEGREPEGMGPATAALFSSEFEDSELGPIPKGWRVESLGEVSKNIREQAKPEILDPATPYIGLEHMPRKSIALMDWGSAEGLASGKFWYRPNDILFGKLRPYFHKVGVASDDGVCSTDILVIRPESPEWLSYAAMHFSSDTLVSYATQLSNGAKMPRTNWRDLAKFQVALPPARVAGAFDDIVRPMISRIHANIATAANLTELRDTLLPRLVSGKLRLREVEGIAP